MSTQRHIEIAATVLLLALSACFVKGWLGEREVRIKAEAVNAANEKVVAESNAAIEKRDEESRLFADHLASEAAAVKTSQQAAQILIKYLPAPATGEAPPAIATIQRNELSAEVQKKLPEAPEYSLLTPGEIQQVAKTELACEATFKGLSTCQADQADLRRQLELKGQEADSWKTAAKGGTKFQRLLKVAKLAACAGGGAAIGAVSSRGATYQSPAVAAGAAGGVIACSIF